MKRETHSGFTMVETLIVIAISIILAGISIPVMSNAMKNYYETATVSATSGAISGTRFLAIMKGYPYEIIFTSSTMSYQVYNEPGGVACPPVFSAVGTSIPLPAAGGVSMTGTTVTYTFYANGTVYGAIPTTAPCLAPAASTLQIKNSVKSNTITVSGVGNVSTSSP